MDTIEEALKLTDVDLVYEQIEIRRDLMSQMVGTLYPSILQDEIIQLTKLFNKLKRSSK
jgi:hypothetical protein